MLLDNNGKLSAVKNTVDTKIAKYQNSVGTAQLVTVWYNPDFDPATQRRPFTMYVCYKFLHCDILCMMCWP